MGTDKQMAWFKKNFWILNSKGNLDNAFARFSEALKEKNKITNKFFTEKELASKYKKYKLWHANEKKGFTKGGLDPLASISDYFMEGMHQSDYDEYKEPILERDDYLFGKDFL